MPTNHTTNYSLNQWVKSDQVKMEDFNADNAKIDAALKAHDTALASKASTSALNSLKTTVNGKASTSALTELQSTLNSKISGLQSTITSQGTALDLRNCQVHFATRTGDGGSTPTFTFPRKPWVVIFFLSSYHGLVAVRGGSKLYAIGGDSRDFNTAAYQFSGNSVTFTAGGSYVNRKSETITVFALLEI